MGETTERQRHPDSPSAASYIPSVETGELQVRIPCRGKSAERVLDEVAAGLAEAVLLDCNPLLVLEDLGQLADSITALIKGLSRLTDGYPRTVSCWESSGYAEAFLSVIDAPRSSPSAEPPPEEPAV